MQYLQNLQTKLFTVTIDKAGNICIYLRNIIKLSYVITITNNNNSHNDCVKIDVSEEQL